MQPESTIIGLVIVVTGLIYNQILVQKSKDYTYHGIVLSIGIWLFIGSGSSILIDQYTSEPVAGVLAIGAVYAGIYASNFAFWIIRKMAANVGKRAYRKVRGSHG